MKLNLGCGTRLMEGYVNVDIRQEPNPSEHADKLTCQPDVIDDIKTLSKFENNSADLIYNCHVFEHFYRNERLSILKRWFDVLKPGGNFRIAVPDFDAVAKAHVEKIVPFEKLWSSLNGSQRHPYDVHLHVYTMETLKSDLESVGFINVKRYDAWEFLADWDDYSKATHPHMSGKSGYLLSLNVEADKPK